MLRWIKRVVVTVVLLAILAIGAVLGALHTDWGRDKLRAEVERQLAAQFPGGAKVGKVEGSVFGELVLRDIELDGRDGKPMVVIGVLRLEVALPPLLEKVVHVDHVEAEDVVVSIRPQPPAPPEPAATEPAGPSSGPGWRIEMPRIDVHDASVAVTTTTITNIPDASPGSAGARSAAEGRRGVSIELEHVTVGAAFEMSRRGAIQAQVAVRGTWRGGPIVATALARYDGGELVVPYASAQAEGAIVSALNVRAGAAGLGGVVSARAPAKTIADLAGVEVPGDVVLVVDGDGDRVGLDATIGASRVVARGTVDVATTTARGVVSVTSDDLAAVTRGAVAGHGTVAIAAVASPAGVHGIVTVRGQVEDIEESRAVIAVDATRAGGRLVAVARRADNARLTITADVTRTGDAITLTRARILANARDAAPGVRGVVYLDADAQGALWPAPALVVDADLDAEHVSVAAGGVDGVQAHVTARGIPGAIRGHAHAVASGLRGGGASGVRIPAATIDSDVAVAADGTITLANVSHEIRTLVGTWAGNGGRVSIATAPVRVSVTNLHTGTAGSAITVSSASFAPATGDLAASVSAQNVTLAAFVPGAPGSVDASASVSRTGGAWAGKVHVDARGVGRAELPIDATVDVALAGRKVRLDAHATSDAAEATLTAELDAPRDLTNPVAWRALDRRAIHSLVLDVPRVDAARLAALAPGLSGAGSGSLTIANGDVHGTFHATGIRVGPETADVEIALAPGDGGEVNADATANVSNVVRPTALARLALPARVFDPAAWAALDRSALRGAVVTIADTALDRPTLLALGVDVPYTGRVAATIDIGPGGDAGLVDATVSGVIGGQLQKPVDVHLTGKLDHVGAHAEVDVTAGATPILSASATVPLTLDDLGTPGRLQGVALSGTVDTPELAAKDLLALVGRHDVTAGTVRARFTVAGTLGTPTGAGTVTAKAIKIVPPLAGRDAPTLEDLDITAEWGGESGELDVDAHEAGGKLHVLATGTPLHLGAVDGALDATSFDLAPIAAFLPGTLGAMTGVVTVAALRYDSTNQAVTGHAHFTGASLPLSSQLGTFRDAAIDLDVLGDKVDAKLDGKLGDGTAHGTATVALAGAIPKTVHADLTLTEVTPLGAIRPKVNAQLTADLASNPQTGHWRGTLAVNNAYAVVSLKFADDLLSVGAPDDMVFVDAPPTAPKLRDIHVPEPTKPWLRVDIAINQAQFETVDTSKRGVLGGVVGNVHGQVSTTRDLELVYGDDGIGILNGQIVADRGDLELVGRRYDVDIAELDFDGPIYPTVVARIEHSFPELTLTVDVGGRLPSELTITPRSDSSTYTEDQLYGFLFGGDPGGDPANAAQDAATAAGVAVASAVAGRAVNQGLERAHVPVKVDVLRYSAATATSSASFEVGKWLFGKLYLAYRQHLEALPTENINEGDLQYYFQKHVLLDTSVGDRQYDSADILYRLRW